MSITLFLTDEELGLFTADDVYYYTIDNRPIRKIQKNILALKHHAADLEDKSRYVASFVVESPSMETSVGGIFVAEKAAVITQVVVSQGTGGSSGSHVINPKVNGVSIYGSPADKPALAYNDSDNLVVSVAPNISNAAVPAGSSLTIDVESVQAGTPRWLRVDVWMKPNIVSVDSSTE